MQDFDTNDIGFRPRQSNASPLGTSLTPQYFRTTGPIGSFKKGGKIKKTGLYKLHKGETVRRAGRRK